MKTTIEKDNFEKIKVKKGIMFEWETKLSASEISVQKSKMEIDKNFNLLKNRLILLEASYLFDVDIKSLLTNKEENKLYIQFSIFESTKISEDELLNNLMIHKIEKTKDSVNDLLVNISKEFRKILDAYFFEDKNLLKINVSTLL